MKNLTVTNFGKPYVELHKQAYSGWEVWQMVSKNNFKNSKAKADQALYDKMGWARSRKIQRPRKSSATSAMERELFSNEEHMDKGC